MGRKQGPAGYIMDAMGDALLGLMDEKPFDSITIQEIAERSGAGRATFFRHFKSKSDLLICRIIGMWSQYLISQSKESADPLPVLFEFFYTNRNTIRKAFQADPQGSIAANLISKLLDSVGLFIIDENSSGTDRYFKAYKRQGMIGIISEWIMKGCTETPAEMIYMISRFI